MPCPRETGAISCDFGNAEPIDLPLKTICEGRNIVVQRAVLATIKAADPRGQLSVEWLDRGPAGDMVVAATRTLILGPTLQIPIARSADRFVRFKQLGSAPVTVRSDQLGAPDPWVLTRPKDGGELTARLESATVFPERYSVVGSGWMTEVSAPQTDFFAITPMPAGKYEVQPVYAGGLRGRPIAASIETGKSSALFLPKENVGSVDLVVEPAVCAETSGLTIVNVERARSITTRRSVVALRNEGDNCSRTVAGLRPGKYEVVFSKA